MKRLLAILLAVAMLTMVMAGCGSSAPATEAPADSGDATGETPADTGSDSYKLALLVAVRNEFNTVMETACIEDAEANGCEITAYDANEDISLQISQAQTCATGGFDGLIIQPVANDSSPELKNAAGELPVAFVNRMPTDTSILDGTTATYVGSNEYDFGYYQGQYLAQLLKDAGETAANAVLFRGPLANDSVRLRSEGAADALKESGLEVNFVFDDTAEWDRAKAMEKMVQFIGSGKEYNCVIANNDEMALGVIEAYATTVGEPPVPVVGIDATQNGCNAIKEGTLACSVFQDAAGQGQGAVDAVIALIKGEKPTNMADDNVVWIPVVAVTPENVDEFIA